MTSTSPDLNGALNGFYKDREWPFKIMWGGFINCTAFGLFNINLGFLPLSFAMLGFTYGYLLRAQRQSIKGELEKLPDWNDIIDLLVSGLSWMAICLGFAFFVLSLVAVSLLVAGQTKTLNMASHSFLGWAIGTFLAAYVLAMVFKFFLAVLMANFAEEEKMIAGFAWRKVIVRVARRPGTLLIAWLAGLTISFAAVLIPSITVVGVVIVPFLAFLAEVIAVRMIGQAWAES